MVFGDVNRVRTNSSAMQARLSQNKLNIKLEGVMTRLSTGRLINRAEDNAAGYSISNKLNSRIHGLNSALNNIGDTKSMLNIADSSYQQTVDQLIEMKSLATRAVNDTVGIEEREYLLKQIEKLGDEVNTIANQAVYQDVELLNGNKNNYIHPKKMTAMAGERSDDHFDMELPPVNLTKLFEGSNHLIGTGSRSYTDGSFYAGLWNTRTPEALTTEATAASTDADLTTNAGETAEKIIFEADGTTYTATIPGYTDTPDTGDLGAIESAINSAGVPGLSAAIESGELTWSNKSDKEITIEITDSSDNSVGISPISLDAAEVIEKVRVTVGGVSQEANLSTPQVGELDISVFADSIQNMNIQNLSAYMMNEYNPDRLGVHSTSFEDINIEFLNSDGDTANIATFNMLSPKANIVYVNGPDGTSSSPITEYTSYPDDELMYEYENIINDLELDGFWAKYDEELQRLIVNNTTNDNFTISVGSTSAGSPGINPKFSEAPDELIPQGKLYFGRAGDDLATTDEIRMFMRETDRAIEDMMGHMNNLVSCQV